MSKLKAPTARCILGVPCPDHGFYHGGEAEELREKFEALENALDESENYADDSNGHAGDAARRIRRVLDEVDARDSLGYLEVEGEDDDEEEYYVLSLKYSKGAECQVLLWWRPKNAGYTMFLESAGRYKASEIKAKLAYYNDGESTVAISCQDVERRAHLAVDVDEKFELRKLAAFEVTRR